MEEKLWMAILKYFGPSGVIAIYLFWKHYLEPKEKRKKGTYVSYKEITDRLDNISMRASDLQNRLDHHLEKEAEEDIRMKAMEKDIEFNQREIKDNKDNVQNIFKILSEIKSLMIQQQSRG